MTAAERNALRAKAEAAGSLGFAYLPALVVLEVAELFERAADQLERFNQRHEPEPEPEPEPAAPAPAKRVRKVPPA